MVTNILSRITGVHHIGDSINTGLFGFYNFGPTLTRCVEGHIRRHESNPKTRLWIYVTSEGLKKDDGRTAIIEQLPIIVVVESEVAPINYTCKVSLQADRKDFFSFNDAQLSWVKNGNISFLQSASLFRDPDDALALLPFKKPSLIDSLEPLPVNDVQVEYKGRAIFAKTRNDVIHSINLEEDLDLAIDLCPLITAVKAAKQIKRDKEAGRALTEKNLFSHMVANLAEEDHMDESSVRASLEAMKVYKVYPEYEPETLPPPREVDLWLGGKQKKGDVKHANLDSLFGYVDGYY